MIKEYNVDWLIIVYVLCSDRLLMKSIRFWMNRNLEGAVLQIDRFLTTSFLLPFKLTFTSFSLISLSSRQIGKLKNCTTLLITLGWTSFFFFSTTFQTVCKHHFLAFQGFLSTRHISRNKKSQQKREF